MHGAARSAAIVGVLAAAVFALTATVAAAAPPGLVRPISGDPFSDPASQHQTEVEPDDLAVGNTVVSAFQVGRFFDGGSSSLGFATSTDGGQNWVSGILPNLTTSSRPAGSLDRASDPSVAYDAVHGVWLVAGIGLKESPSRATSIVVSRSADGLVWTAPVTAAAAVGSFAHDKPWIACDNWAGSRFRGRCYLSYTDIADSNKIATRTSLDGGLTWGPAIVSTDLAAVGLGAQPVVQPNGVLVIPFLANDLVAVRSTDGGATFGGVAVIAPVAAHSPEGLRAWHLPSVDVDGSGKLFVAWQDCSFRVGCSNSGTSPVANDIVYSTSADGVAWTAPTRVPIEDIASGVDHVIPALAVDRRTRGPGASIALVYYSLPSASCSTETCRISAGFIASGDGGATWTSPVELSAQPMSLSWLADTSQGRMLGDYVSAAFTEGGVAVPVVALADPFDGILREAVFAGALAPPRSVPPPPPPSPSTAPPAQFSVTIAASRSVVVYGRNILLSGIVSSRQAGESVDVTNVGAVATTSGGEWRHVATPKLSSSYRARWHGAASKAVSVAVRPLLTVAARRRSLSVRVVAARSFAGRTVWLERRHAGRWRAVGRAVLDRRSAAAFNPRLPRGVSVVRAVLPQQQARPGYLAGFSPPLRVHR